MYKFIVALVLFLVTGYLTVTEMASCIFVDFIFASAALGVLLPVYACVTDFVSRIVTLHDCYEHVNMDTPHLKGYSENYAQALLQIALQQLYGMLSKVVLGIWQSVYPTLSSMIKLAITCLRITRSRRKNHRKASPYSTLRISIISVSLVYVVYWYFPSATSYAALRLAGLVLRLLVIIIVVLVLIYWFQKHPMIQQIGSNIYALFDKERNAATYLKPEPQPKQTDATESKKRPACAKPTNTPTHVSSPKAEARWIQREEEEAQKAYYADPGQIGPSRSARQFPLSGSTTRRGWNAIRQDLASSAGCNAPLPTSIGQSPGYTSGYLMETPRQPIKTPRLARLSNSSLESQSASSELNLSTSTSDGLTQANKSVDVPSRTINNVSVALPPSKDTLTIPERTNKLITEVRVESNDLPMRAPKVVAEAQVACGENKGAALLRRSQWKQKNKYRLATKKEVEKVNAPAVVRPNSQMDTNADWNAADMSEMEEDEVYMEMDSRRSSPIGSPMVCSPTGSPSPMHVSSPMELSSPMRVPSPMQISSPMRVSPPAQVSAPFQASAPVPALAPVQVPAPVAPAVAAPAAMAEAAPGVRKIRELPRRKTGAAHSSRIDAPSSSVVSPLTRTALAAQSTPSPCSGLPGSGPSASDSKLRKPNGLKRTSAFYMPSTGPTPPHSNMSVSSLWIPGPTPSQPSKLARTSAYRAPSGGSVLVSRSGDSIDTPKSFQESNKSTRWAAFRTPEPGKAPPRPKHSGSGSGSPELDSMPSKLNKLTRRPALSTPSEMSPRSEPSGFRPSPSDSKPSTPNALTRSVAFCAPAVMTPKDLVAAMDKKATSITGTRTGRAAPVYTLMDKERTVVKKGEIIPPNTAYQMKDAKGTRLLVTGSKGLRV